MSVHKCNCKFVPDIVLENLAKSGVGEARISLHQSGAIRDARADADVPIESVAGIAPPGQGPRKVYDCESTFTQRKTEVRDEGGPATADGVETDMYKNAGITSDYFKDELSRNSYDNVGSDIVLNIHYGVKYMNAFWDGDELTFGDGNGVVFVNFAQSLDVVAHEFGHGVTQFTANLKYLSQSGALNEHFSDVFGSAITQHAEGQDAGSADWLIGDEIMGPDLYGEALRSMKAPGTAYDNPLMGTDPQPDHMKNYYAGSRDNQGVHINSGIPNKAFYLTAMSIGTDKAVQVWYHGLQNLWRLANFNDAVAVIVNSARILTKNGQTPIGTTQTVRSAFRAVGLPT